MPTNKDFKRLVRRRMHKTGEAYTTARAHLLKPRPSRPAPTARAASALPEPGVVAAADYPRLAGMSDAAIKAKTGCTWELWVKALDYAKAETWPHRDITEYISRKFKVDDWWCQTVAVGYERIKGLRAIGQRRDGTYEATKSRTFPVSVSRLYRACHDSKTRARWLLGVELAVRAATRNKSIRISWPDRSSVEVLFTAKGTGKSQLAIQHRKLPDRATVTRMKEFWSERLGDLSGILSEKRA